MSRIFIILSVFLLLGCSESLDIQLAPEVTVFVSHDNEKRIRLTPDNEHYVALNDWLKKHKSGWYTTSGRYPGGVYIKSGTDGIQVNKTHVILYSTTGPEPRAIYIQKFAGGELSGIRSIGQ